MKRLLLIVSVLLLIVLCAFLFIRRSTTNQVHGKIQIGDGSQKTGFAPIWIYDASETELSKSNGLPDFGGRSRSDFARIRKMYPAILNVWSNYNAAVQKAAAMEMTYRATNEIYQTAKEAENNQNGGSESKKAQKLEEAMNHTSETRWQAVDDSDDQREFIFYWFNVNPGILYSTMPRLLAKTMTDKNGNFSFDMLNTKNTLLAVHVEETINGQTEQYFWLLNVPLNGAKTDDILLNDTNALFHKKNSELKPAWILTPDTSVYIATPHRVRDTRQDY
jgi:hypothetical protein